MHAVMTMAAIANAAVAGQTLGVLDLMALTALLACDASWLAAVSTTLLVYSE